MTLLKNVNLKVYQSEKIAIIAEKDSGRQSLINLLLMMERRDETDSIFDQKKNLPPKNITAFDLGHRKHRKSYFEMMGENIDYCDKNKLRKEMIYLSQYPSLFSGSVRDNIDPYNQFSTKEIIRTLHFLKVFVALQSFTGFENCHEMAITLKEKEGKFEVNEIDIDDFFTISAQEKLKNKQNRGFKELQRSSIDSTRRRSSKRRMSDKRRLSNLEIPMNKVKENKFIYLIRILLIYSVVKKN